MPYREIKYWGTQCPLHRPDLYSQEHDVCIKKWKKDAMKQYKNSLEYKQIEVINALIERLNST